MMFEKCASCYMLYLRGISELSKHGLVGVIAEATRMHLVHVL